jgi:hypothetical protein
MENIHFVARNTNHAAVGADPEAVTGQPGRLGSAASAETVDNNSTTPNKPQ